MNRIGVVILAAALALAAAVVAGCGGDDARPGAATVVRTVTVTTPARASAASLVAKVLPAIVNVRTRQFDGGSAEGSGVVIDRNGIVVTNYHVISGARTVRLSFNDGRHKQALVGEVIGAAPERDIAIIGVAARDLVPVPLGRSSRLRLGDPVLAIGFPLDLGGPTVTEGIVSGVNRTIRPDQGPTLEGLLQTDAAINPGNSGGALIDADGRLAGINTAAASAGAAENIGFAIAIDGARPVIDEIRKQPASRRAWLGASFGSVSTAAAAVQLGLQPDVRGAVAVAVFANGPAAKAGLREGDVMVSINGAAVRSATDVASATSKLDPGDRAVLEVVDRSGPRRVTLTVGRRPATLGGR